MQLPQSLSQDLAELVSTQIPWAIRRLRHLADLPPAERQGAWQSTWANALPARKSALITYLGGLLEAPAQNRFILQNRPLPAEFSGWYKAVRGQLEHFLGEPVLPIEISTAVESVAAKSTALSLDPRGVSPALWEKQIAHIRKVRQAFAGRNDNGNFGNLLCSAYISLGMSCVQAGQRKEAIQAFDEAITIADAQHNLPQVITGVYHLAALYSQGAQDINRALQRVLPLWEQYHQEPPSLDLAQLADTLATAYARVGDAFETRHFTTTAATTLTAAGFPLADETEMSVSLRAWIVAARARMEVNQNNYADFQRALTLWLSHIRLRQQFTRDPDVWQFLQERAGLIQDTYHQVTAIFNAQLREDNALMRAMQGAYEYDPIDAKVAATPPGDIRESIDARLERKEFSEALLRDIQAVFARPEVQQDKRLRMANLWRLGACQHGLGRSVLAGRHLRQAHHLAEEIGGLDDVLFAIYQRAAVLPPTEEKAILDLCLAGIAKTEAARSNVITPYQQSAFFNGRTELYKMAIAWARELGGWDTVLGVGDLLKARNFLLPVNDPAALQSLRAALDGHYQALGTATASARHELLRQRQLSYDNWLLKNMGPAPRWQAVLPVTQLQEHLQPGEAALSYYEINDGRWLVVLITPDQLVQEMIHVRPEQMAGWLQGIGRLGDPGGNYRARGIGVYQGKAKPVEIRKKAPSAEKALEELSDFLLPPLIQAGLERADRLYVCPQQLLHRIPFHALTSGQQYLIEKLAISYLPNLRSLLYKDAVFSNDRGVVLIGTGTFRADGETVLADLVGAREEVEHLAREYRSGGIPVTELTGDLARRESILSAGANGILDRHDVIHIALHGEDVPTDNPLDARLFVRDGSIDGFDISHWKLSAELVVLSACFAGVRAVAGRGLEYLPGDDLFGLQAAFFSAGARRVFGALWPVADQPGKTLMIDFHRRLADHPPARAWQQTVVAHLATAPDSVRSPAFWAPFFLVEEGRGEG